MDTFLGFLLGVVLTVSLIAVGRLATGARRVLAPSEEATRAALHAAATTLPHLRTGLAAESAERSIRQLHALMGGAAAVLVDRTQVLAAAGTDGLRAGDPWPAWLHAGRDDRVHVEPHLDDPAFGAAVVAPLVVRSARVGSLVALFEPGRHVRPEDTRVTSEVAALVAAQVELAVVAEQDERLARAELRALRAQISPHFIYNALAAVASYIHSSPDEARELLTEFAEFTRYAFRGERANVTVADELHYVEKYLRLEQARFGDRLAVRVSVDPDVLTAVVPVLSLQPLVENAVRHGVERVPGRCLVEITGEDLGADVQVSVRDDGPGMSEEQVRRALDGAAGGIGAANVNQRLQATFGSGYGLRVDSAPGHGTTVRLLVPKFRPGVRAA